MNINKAKIYVGPMSKNIVDAVINYCNENKTNIGFIPSRRQIDYNTGYVNGWNTNSWSEYVRSKTEFAVLERDHGGPNQGQFKDNGQDSFKVDADTLDIIHIDIWKQFVDVDECVQATVSYIDLCSSINNKVLFEVGTEEAIYKMDLLYFGRFLNKLFKSIPPSLTDRIAYVVIQSGTRLLGNTNIGVYDENRLKEMIRIAHAFGLNTKEHNGDYLSPAEYHQRFDCGLDAINIAPEFGLMESNVLLSLFNDKELEIFFNECLESKRWEKWVGPDFDPHKNKIELIKICGHYVLSNDKIQEITNKYPQISSLVKEKVFTKLSQILHR